MGYWKRHPRKELEGVLCEFDAKNWRIADPPTYYSVKCPCGEHYRWIHLTPSGPNYAKNALAWLDRQPCSSTDNETETNDQQAGDQEEAP